MVRLAEERVVAKGELVAGDELTVASNASKTFDVVDVGLGSHDEVVLAEPRVALGALCSEQPATERIYRDDLQRSRQLKLK